MKASSLFSPSWNEWYAGSEANMVHNCKVHAWCMHGFNSGHHFCHSSADRSAPWHLKAEHIWYPILLHSSSTHRCGRHSWMVMKSHQWLAKSSFSSLPGNWRWHDRAPVTNLFYSCSGLSLNWFSRPHSFSLFRNVQKGFTSLYEDWKLEKMHDTWPKNGKEEESECIVH